MPSGIEAEPVGSDSYFPLGDDLSGKSQRSTRPLFSGTPYSCKAESGCSASSIL